MLQDVKRIGVLSITNIEPVRDLDIEKVMGRLADGMAQGLARLPDVNIITQDEIRWHFNYAAFDSLNALAPQTRATLREELELDAMVYVELNSLQAQEFDFLTIRMMSICPNLSMSKQSWYFALLK